MLLLWYVNEEDQFYYTCYIICIQTWGEAVLGPVVRALPIFISISALGSANGSLFGAARYCMVGAQYGYLPEVFACIHIRRLTPVFGVILEVVCSI
jgi:amino acid transporter